MKEDIKSSRTGGRKSAVDQMGLSCIDSGSLGRQRGRMELSATLTKSLRLAAISIFVILLSLGSPDRASAQTCSGSGGGGPTLITITLDGIPSDWSPVLSNPLQYTADGEFVNPCGGANPVDRDCTNFGYTNISGRDLSQFAWTYDATNVYLYLRRFGSDNNQDSFYFYCDTNSNQRMNTGEKVFWVSFSGGGKKLDGHVLDYNAFGGIYGDAAGDYMADPATGFADGYKLHGTDSNQVNLYANQLWVFADGSGFEANIPWTNLGVPVGTPIYFHVSSKNGSTSSFGSGIDDDLGGPGGTLGVFGFRLASLVASQAQNVATGTAFVDYVHTLTNTGTLSDRYNFKGISTQGWKVELFDRSTGTPGTLMATDLTGDGIWNSVTPAYDFDTNGQPDTGAAALGANGTFLVTLRLTPLTGANNVQDVTTLTATSIASPTCVHPSVADTTAIGDLSLTPTPQAKSVMINQAVDYGLKLTNFSLSDTFDFRAISSLGFRIDIYTDPNGDGNPADGVLVATDLNGNGSYADAGDSIQAGFNTNANGLPDFGAIANGGIKNIVIRITAGATVNVVDTTTVTAQGATYGKTATAVLTTSVLPRLSLTPSYTTALGTNKFSGPGVSVFYAHLLVNSFGTADSVTLSGLSNQGYTVRFWTDPNGDGNPSDGTLIAGPVALGAFGGSLRIVVEVQIPTGIAVGIIDTTTVTAASSLAPPFSTTATDQVRISRVSTYSDSLRTLNATSFARCDTVYVLGNNLTADMPTDYQLRYINSASLTVRTYVLPTDGSGNGIDQYTFTSSDAVGNWTIELRTGAPGYATILDTITIKVDPVGTPSTIAPLALDQASYALFGDSLSITATFNNASPTTTYVSTVFQYVIVNAGATQYLQAGGTFAAYTGTQTTRTTSPHDVAPLSSVTETVTIGSVTFPAAGTYQVRMSWIGSCGNTIATATLNVPVGTTIGSFGSAGGVGPKEIFGTGQTVFLYGSNYLASTAYKVAYYSPAGTLFTTQSVSSDASANLSTSNTTAALGTNGLWHVAVYPASSSIPATFNALDAGSLAMDSFTVDTVAPTLSITKPTATSYVPLNDEDFATAGFQLTPNGIMELGSTVSLVSLVANSGGPAPTLGAVTYPTTTSWTFAQATWPIGNYTLTVRATDAASNTTDVAVTFSVRPASPIVSSPILAGATTVSGTSVSPVGSAINVYDNGVLIGTTTVLAGGVWTLSGVGPLVDGHSITATVTVNGTASLPSQPVVVSANPADVTPTPTVSSPINAGATSISGTSSSPAGTLIDVYVNGVFAGQTTVGAGGVWTLSGVLPLADGDAVVATATDLAGGHGTSAPSPTVYVSANAGDQTPTPTINAPVYSNDTSVGGTSTAPVGTIITVYKNGVFLGATTVGAGGVWTLSGVSGLVAGNVLTATATDLANNHGTSGPSAPVTVIAPGPIPNPPTLTSPVFAGATSISGTSDAPVGSVIKVYVNGVLVGTTTVVAGGTFNLTGVGPLVDGQTLTATVKVAGSTSPLSAPVVVSANAADVTPRPTVDSPVFAGATSISGTSSSPAGTLIDVFVDGIYVGQTAVIGGGTWSITGVGPLLDGQAITATATDAGNNKGTSAPSVPVYVSANAGNVTPPPVVTSPIFSGLTTVTGTSTQPAGTIIDVFVNGVVVGKTTVNANGTWYLTGLSPLLSGDVVTAKATNLAAGMGTSASSAPVVVVPAAPVISSALQAGATSVSGTSAQPVGSTIKVYDNGVLIGTTTVGAGGTWTLSSIGPLVDGHTITATVTVGSQTSGLSSAVVVSGGAPDVTQAPSVTGPIAVGATTITGTSLEPPGTVIDTFVNGVIVGTTTVLPDGTWVVTGVGPLSSGDSVTATATDTAAGQGTSPQSTPVVVGPKPPFVSSSILAGATSVSGTSTEPEGSTITVYVNGIAVGTATVTLGGGWTLTGIGPLADGQQVTATVTVGSQTSGLSAQVTVSANLADVTATPTVNGPIIKGTTTVTGTSSEPPGTIIDVYVNGVLVGSTTVQSGGTWSLPGVGPLTTGDVIQATATDVAGGNGTSNPSTPVTVQADPPQVTGPILAAATSVSGTSTELPGSTITVYVNGVSVGTTVVQSNGTWTLTGIAPLVDGNVITAIVTVGSLVSGPSGPVVVAANAADVTPPPSVTDPIAALATSVSGTGIPGATVNVYVDGVFVGTAVVGGGGGWTLSGLSPLQPGQLVAATQNLAPGGTSTSSSPVIVGPIPDLLRNDRVTSTFPVVIPSVSVVFKRSASLLPGPTLDPYGPDGVPQIGEGILTQGSGSSDDDDFYMRQIVSGTVDPDPTVLTDYSRVLVLYELAGNNGNTLRLEKSGSNILITY